MTERQQRFVEEFLIDMNGAAAARRSGYKGKYPDRSAAAMRRIPEVAAAIDAAVAERSKRTGITADYVLEGIKEVAERSMAEESYDASAALKAFELLGKHLKMWTDKTETNLSGGLVIGWDNGTNNDSV